MYYYGYVAAFLAPQEEEEEKEQKYCNDFLSLSPSQHMQAVGKNFFPEMRIPTCKRYFYFRSTAK